METFLSSLRTSITVTPSRPSFPRVTPSRPSFPRVLQSCPSFPRVIISLETLRFIGLNETTANDVWHRWGNCHEFPHMPARETETGSNRFLTMITSSIRHHPRDACGPRDADWYRTMIAYGLDNELINVIMDRRFKPIRLTESCKYWVADTLEGRYHGLEAIHAASRERASAAQPHQTRFRHPFMSSIPASAPEVRDSGLNKITLWRGTYVHSIQRCFNKDGRLESFDHMQRWEQGDFSPRRHAIYLVDDYEIAALYACWAKHRASYASVAVLRVEMGNSAIENLLPPDRLEFRHEETWQRLVWHSRRHDRPPCDLVKYCNAIVVIGHVCGKPDIVVQKMQFSEDLSFLCRLQNRHGDLVVQYAFIDEQGSDFLTAYAKRGTTVHNVALSR